MVLLSTIEFLAPTFEYLDNMAEGAVASTVGALYLVNCIMTVMPSGLLNGPE